MATPGQSSRFSRVRFRAGYSIVEVDALIARIEGTLDLALQTSSPVTAEDVRAAQFSSGRLRVGYLQDEVDDALDRYEEQLRQAEAW